MKRMYVIAAKEGQVVPVRGERRMITSSEPVKVPRDSYYLRLIQDGSLKEVEPPADTSGTPAPSGAEAKQSAPTGRGRGKNTQDKED